MTGTGLTPYRPVEGAVALSRALEVTGIWQMGRESPRETVQARHAVAAAAVANGEVTALVAALEAKPTPKEFAVLLDNLLGSFAPRKDQNMQVFSKMLAIDVAGVGASRAALEAACKALRASCTFLPSIEEVLEAVKWQKKVCEARVRLLERLPARIAAAEAVINSKDELPTTSEENPK